MNEKTNVRYEGFRSNDDGGRVFDFSVAEVAHIPFLVSIEIPKAHFVGLNRIRLQEGVGVSYAKLKHLLSIEAAENIPQLLCLSVMDLAQYRQVPLESKRRWGYGNKKTDASAKGQSS